MLGTIVELMALPDIILMELENLSRLAELRPSALVVEYRKVTELIQGGERSLKEASPIARYDPDGL